MNQENCLKSLFYFSYFSTNLYSYICVVIDVFEFLSIPENISRYNSEKLFNTYFMYPLFCFGKKYDALNYHFNRSTVLRGSKGNKRYLN